MSNGKALQPTVGGGEKTTQLLKLYAYTSAQLFKHTPEDNHGKEIVAELILSEEDPSVSHIDVSQLQCIVFRGRRSSHVL